MEVGKWGLRGEDPVYPDGRGLQVVLLAVAGVAFRYGFLRGRTGWLGLWEKLLLRDYD